MSSHSPSASSTRGTTRSTRETTSRPWKRFGASPAAGSATGSIRSEGVSSWGEVQAEAAKEVYGEGGFPVQLDLHSYLRGGDEGGRHFTRRPEGWGRWLDLCDSLQVNREELSTLVQREGSVDDMGEDLWEICGSRRVSCLLITEGERGSCGWHMEKGGTTRRCYIPAEPGSDAVDPTGGGDVYGASFFLFRMRGESMEGSMKKASRLAGLQCERSGTRQLAAYLREGMLRAGKEEIPDPGSSNGRA